MTRLDEAHESKLRPLKHDHRKINRGEAMQLAPSSEGASMLRIKNLGIETDLVPYFVLGHLNDCGEVLIMRSVNNTVSNGLCYTKPILD